MGFNFFKFKVETEVLSPTLGQAHKQFQNYQSPKNGKKYLFFGKIKLFYIKSFILIVDQFISNLINSIKF